MVTAYGISASPMLKVTLDHANTNLVVFFVVFKYQIIYIASPVGVNVLNQPVLHFLTGCHYSQSRFAAIVSAGTNSLVHESNAQTF